MSPNATHSDTQFEQHNVAHRFPMKARLLQINCQYIYEAPCPINSPWDLNWLINHWLYAAPSAFSQLQWMSCFKLAKNVTV